jgi:sugar phosphate isomerase/epimerase
MFNKRDFLKITGLAATGAILPGFSLAVKNMRAVAAPPFRFCLNTSTIMGQKPGLLKSIDIASMAGYDGVELWISDVKEYLKNNTLESLAIYIKSKNITVENTISFTTWMVNDNALREAGLKELEEEMKIMSVLGCKRIAAPPSGVEKGDTIDFSKAGSYYRDTLNLGRKYGVIPQLEFWGASGTLYNLGQALAIAASADDPDAHILPDVYHLFRGGSGFNGLRLVNGNAIDIIHINDYPASKPVNEQTDADRVYPGDGAAPLKQILTILKTIGGTKVLSLELFNRAYWQQDTLTVAKTGLNKIKKIVEEVLA